MRSHLTAFGVGAGLSLLAAGAFVMIAPKFAAYDEDSDGVHIVDNDGGERGSFHLKDKTVNLTADWSGVFAFAADGRSLTLLDGMLVVRLKEKGGERKAVFERKDGAIAANVFRGDKAVAAGEEADAVAGDLLQLFARSSGVGAGERVAAMIEAGGKERVMEEIGLLSGGHAVGAYVEALAEAASLDDADVVSIADRIRKIESDYAKRMAIIALLREPEIGEGALNELIDAARTIEGDHELRLIVQDIAEKDLSERNFDVAAKLVESIKGAHEVRLAVSALLESESLGDAEAARALDIAAKSIEGDYELRLAIEAAGARLASKDVGAAAIRAIPAISGSHDSRLAIEALAAEFDEASPHWLALIDAVSAIDGDHERRLALESLAGEAPETEEIRAALRRAAEAIGSEHDRRLVLEALQ